jgi:hypothetical protein
MIKHFFLAFLFLLGLAAAGKAAGTNTEAAVGLPTDSSVVVVKNVSPEVLKQYLGDADFTYTRTQPVVNGFWAKILNKIAEQLNNAVNHNVVSWLLIAVFFVVFVYLMILLVGGDFQTLFSRNKAANVVGDTFVEVDLTGTDFDKLVARELENGNLNLAIRYMYLKLLQALSHKQLIVWQKDKTNRQYAQELSMKPYHQHFKQVTNAYEYVWYGKFQISMPVYHDVRDGINQLIEQVNG